MDIEMLRGIRITSADTVRIGEREHGGLRDYLVPWLQCEIYKNFFCGMRPVSVAAPISAFLSALCEANAGQESFTAQQGCYMALGQPEPTGTKWLRLYWNVNPSGAIVLVRIATGILSRLRTPFRLKVLLDTSVARRDAAVLYVPLASWPAARDIIGPIGRELDESRNLETTTPLFTKTLRPGVGLAEDPQTGLSFGMHRSGIVARSLARSYLAGHTSEDQQWSGLRAEFEREKLSIDRAYLNAGSADVYEF
jgi:HopA1 effector protein family